MTEDQIIGFIIVTVIGIAEVGFGLWILFGGFKRWYIGRGIPGFFPKGFVYNSIPIGVAFLLLAGFILTTSEKFANLLFWGFGIMLLIALAISVLKPGFLKPTWLRWLEDYYGHVLEEMFEEARQMGPRNWEVQVKTQAELENWADGVARKHRWQRRR